MFASRVGNNNQRARQKRLTHNLHEHDIEYMLNFFEHKCAYCGCGLNQDNLWLDHIIPISEDNEDIINFGSTVYNIVPACVKCNISKKNKDLYTWLEKTFDEYEVIYLKIIDYQISAGMNEIIW